MVKCLPAMWETRVWSVGWEDLLEKKMATHSSILAWRIPRMEEHGRLQSMGSQRVGHDWATSLLLFQWSSVDNLISGSSAFSKTSLSIWKFMVHVLLKPGLENFEHYFTSMWDECNCAVVWAFFWHCLSLGLEWKLTFSSPVATAEFSKFAGILSVALSQHHLLGFEIAQLKFHHLH